MRQALIECAEYVAFFIAFGAAVWGLDKLCNIRVHKPKYKCRNKAMKRIVKDKNKGYYVSDFYEKALRHNNSVAADTTERDKPIRKMAGYLAEEFYSLSETERSRIL